MSYDRLHQAQCHDILRSWQSQRNDVNNHKDFVLPIFIINDDDAIEAIESMPGVCRYGCNRAIEYLEPLIYSFGLRAILLFPVITKSAHQTKPNHSTLDESDDDEAVEDSDRGILSSSDSSSTSTSASHSCSSSLSDIEHEVDLPDRLIPVEETANSQNPFLNQNEEEEDHLLELEPSENHQAAPTGDPPLAFVSADVPPPPPAPPLRLAEQQLVMSTSTSKLLDARSIEMFALNEKYNPVLRLIPQLRVRFPELLVICDVCLCTFTSTGHCCLFESHFEQPTASSQSQAKILSEKVSSALNQLPSIDNKTTCRYLAKLSLEYAIRGCQVVAPSDMMDNRVSVIRKHLDNNKLTNVTIMSYSSKFASSFYGPFRQAANSAPEFGDRKTYQLPPGSRALAMRAVSRDIKEGADLVMVKPGGPYLDIVRDIREMHPFLPIAIYQVSGEYSMLRLAAKANILDLKSAVNEMLTAFRRAGASIIITYFTPELLRGEL